MAQLLGAGEGRENRYLNMCLFPMCLLPEIAFAQNIQAGASVGGLEILGGERETGLLVTTSPQPTQSARDVNNHEAGYDETQRGWFCYDSHLREFTPTHT